MKKALITGGAGFIGSHLCTKLIEDGYFVFCVDNLYTGSLRNIDHLKNHPNFVFQLCDISMMGEFEVDEIYNMASPASPVHYQTNPLFTVKTNINAAISLSQLAQKLQAKLFQASTSEVYGEPLVHPQPESYFGNVNPIGPRACYDESKRLAESILFIHYHQHSFPLKVGRIFNTYGPNMHINDGRLISNFIIQALNHEDVTVYGDGTQTRSFCYIDDMIEGILKFMYASNEIIGPINLGNPIEHSVLDMAHLIIQLTSSHSKIVHRPLPENDPTRRKPDISLAKTALNWAPSISLEEGLKKTIAYFSNLTTEKV